MRVCVQLHDCVTCLRWAQEATLRLPPPFITHRIVILPAVVLHTSLGQRVSWAVIKRVQQSTFLLNTDHVWQ